MKSLKVFKGALATAHKHTGGALEVLTRYKGSVTMGMAFRILNGIDGAALDDGMGKLISLLLAGTTAAHGKLFFGKSRGVFGAIVASATQRMVADGADIGLLTETAVKGVRVGLERFLIENPNSNKAPAVKAALAAANQFLLTSGH